MLAHVYLLNMKKLVEQTAMMDYAVFIYTDRDRKVKFDSRNVLMCRDRLL